MRLVLHFCLPTRHQSMVTSPMETLQCRSTILRPNFLVGRLSINTATSLTPTNFFFFFVPPDQLISVLSKRKIAWLTDLVVCCLRGFSLFQPSTKCHQQQPPCG